MNKPSTSDVVWYRATVTRARREQQNGHKSAVHWFTGLSGAGKSTLAHEVEEELHQIGCHTFVLNRDNVRYAQCGDLGFSEDDRKEDIRRNGEGSEFFVETRVIALTAFISPFRADRERVRKLVVDEDFIETYFHCPIEVCEEREPKGLYKKARQGLISNFTEISSPYEIPEHPDLDIDTSANSLEACVARVIDHLKERGKMMRCAERTSNE